MQVIDALESGDTAAADSQRARLNEERSRLGQRSRFNKSLRATIASLVVIAAIAVLAATLFFPVLQVSGTSMEPTLSEGNVVVLLKTSSLERGDLCGFSWQNKVLIKRVIGLPGDVINIDDDGTVSVNGEELDEPYVSTLVRGSCDISFPYQVPDNRYFVLGDSRGVSIDSRNSQIGCVEKSQILGKLVLKVWPLSDLSLLVD